MSDIKFKILEPNDHETIQLIADWYFNEWNITKDNTIKKLTAIAFDNSQFQVLMTLDGEPIGTGGLYNHVGLIDKEPRFNIHKNWLALVYTVPNKRHQGFGALICNFIQDYSKKLGVRQMCLFTDTAERLYQRLGWDELEKISLGERKIVVMKKDL